MVDEWLVSLCLVEFVWYCGHLDGEGAASLFVFASCFNCRFLFSLPLGYHR